MFKISSLFSSKNKKANHVLQKGVLKNQKNFIGKDPTESIKALLIQKFEKFKVHNLKNISPDNFESHINSTIGTIDAEIEGYKENEIEQQRDLSIKFHWGHNHDFGTFQIEGRMRERHFDVLANFVTFFPITVEDFKDKSIFDIGCWTGGTTLMLNSLSPSSILSIDEVKKYVAMTSFLIESFGLNNTKVEARSLYSCNDSNLKNKFDIAFFPGVIYHLSDPVLALRIIYNSLKLDGVVLIESAGINVSQPFCQYEGSRIYHQTGDIKNLNRGGWNWFLPSPSALSRMMTEAGFTNVQTLWDEKSNRVYGYGKKEKQIGICKAGLSVQAID